MDPQEAERTARALQSQLTDMRERTLASGGLNWHQRKLLAESERLAQDPPVREHEPRCYAPPPVARKVLSRESLAELEELLAVVKRANDEVTGLRSSVARVMVEANGQAEEVRARFRAWADGYVAARLSKVHVRAERPIDRCARLVAELQPFLEGLAHADASSHSVLMAEVAHYVAWGFFQGTWAGQVTHHYRGLTLQLELDIEPALRVPAQQVLARLKWDRGQELAQFCRLLRRAAPALPEPEPEPEEGRARLAALAADVLEMRPFLLEGDTQRLEHVIQLGPDLFVGWHWVERTLGLLAVGESEDELHQGWRDGLLRMALSVGFDGRLRGGATPWVDATSPSAEIRRGTALNLLLLEAIHARLFAAFDRIDLAAAFGRVKDAPTLTDEALALAWRFRPHAAEEPAEEPAEAVPPTSEVAPRSSMPASRLGRLRMVRLLNVLETRLGCEVRQGKGSEVVVHRAGGKIARLGRHTRNREIPTVLLRGVLERLGVSFQEWRAALA